MLINNLPRLLLYIRLLGCLTHQESPFPLPFDQISLDLGNDHSAECQPLFRPAISALLLAPTLSLRSTAAFLSAFFAALLRRFLTVFFSTTATRFLASFVPLVHCSPSTFFGLLFPDAAFFISFLYV